MDINFSTEQSSRAGMPATHYVVGWVLNKLCITDDALYGISNLAAILNMSQEAIEDILLNYPDFFAVYVDGTVSIFPECRHLFNDEEDLGGRDMASDVIALFNAVNGTKYTARAYKAQINAIVKKNKKITIEQFESVIRHKAATWGTDDSMRDYNRPATLFRSAARFAIYLDDARRYWSDEFKKQNPIV